MTDEYGDSDEIDALLQGLAERMVKGLETGYVKPPTFLSEAFYKISRDVVWGRARPGLMADYRYFKKHGLDDFPQKEYKARLVNAMVIPWLRVPSFRRAIYKKLKKLMVEPYKKAAETK